jgi:hypothetical protein
VANAAHIVTKSKQDLADCCVRISGHNYDRSWQSRWNRRAKNLANWNAYHSRMDWSHKMPWQTQQTVAEFGISVEQSVGTLERGLTDTNDWLTVDGVGIGDPVINPDTIGLLLKYYLERLWIPGNQAETSYNLANLIGDGIKRALLESIITAKVTGVMDTKYKYRLVESNVVKGKFGHRDSIPLYTQTPPGMQSVAADVIRDFRLCIEVIPWEDWFPDPSSLNRWVCHEATVHVSELGANPDYDTDIVNAIKGTADATYADMYKRVEQDAVFIQHDSDEVRVREFWGDLIDPTTCEVLATNVFWTTCNGQMLRPPTPNPFWHQKRPFVSAALLRTPNSTIHKALADDAVDSWMFLNELISLMFDGALGSVWGKHQMRLDMVENSDDFQQGVPQNPTFLLRPNTPDGYKALEKIDSGEMPAYAMQIYELATRQFQTAMATNDLKLGQMPSQEATATSIVEAMQAAGSLFESIAARVEDTFLEPIFELAWMTILQYELADKLVDPVLVQILGPERVLELTKQTNQERFVLLSQAAKFKCRGLRGVTARARVMTKLANLVQLLGTTPQLAELFGPGGKYSFQRLGEQLLRNSGVDPSTLEKTQEEKDRDAAMQMVQESLDAAGAPTADKLVSPSAGQPPPEAGGGGGSPPALMNASQDQQTDMSMLAPKTPAGMIPGAPQGV